MRIGIVCYPSVGGSGLVATELGMRLAERGHQVHFISYASPFRLPDDPDGIRFHQVDPINYPLFHQNLYTFSLTAKIVEVAEAHELDVVHAHYSIPHSLCAHLANEISSHHFRIVTTLHGTDVTIVGRDKPLFSLNRYGIEQSDAVTTVSHFQRDYTRRYFQLNVPVQVIYNFVDGNRFRPDAADVPRDELAAADECIIMHISNLRAPKNPEAIIGAFRLAREQVKARLVIIGDGPEMVTIRKRCREYGICNSVNHLGNTRDVAAMLPLADVIYQPSYRESFGMVLIEAMACEVPTVSSDIDGIPEVVAAGETGLMADPDDHEALAAHLVALCRDTERRRAMGVAGRRRVLEHFNPDLIVPHYEDCYRRAMDGS